VAVHIPVFPIIPAYLHESRIQQCMATPKHNAASW